MVRNTLKRGKHLVKREIKEIIRLKGLRRSRFARWLRQVRYKDVTTYEFLLMLIAAMFVYAMLFGEMNYAILLVSLLMLLLSVSAYFYDRIYNKSLFVLFFGTSFMLLVVIIWLTALRDPFFGSKIYSALYKAYSPFFEAMENLIKIVKSLMI